MKKKVRLGGRMRGISVAIPYYNTSIFAEVVLLPLLKDERINDIVVMDDHSEDYNEMLSTVKCLDAEGKVRVFRNPRRYGPLRNKVDAVEKCRNDWVIILDSDNTIERDYVDVLFALGRWDEHTIYCPDFAKPHFNFTRWSGRTIDRKNIKNMIEVGGERVVQMLCDMNYFVNKSEFLKAVEAYKNDDYTAMDVLYVNTLWLERGNKLKIVKGLQYIHRIHGDSSCMKANPKKTRKDMQSLIKRLTGANGKHFIGRNMVKSPIKKGSPLGEIPAKLLDEYSMDGRMGVKHRYLDDTYSPEKPLVYKREAVDLYIQQIKRKKTFQYRITDLWLYKALERHSISGKRVAVMGSIEPVYESICLFYGGKPTTIEYNKIISEDPRVVVMTPEEYDKNPVKFDAAFSISSFEHDGLGRYGDPLNPNGDLQAMRKMKSMVNPGGLLFLAVPVGRDTLVWNAHRIYGRLRLPMLLEGWRILDVFGWQELLLNVNRGTGHGDQPVFVLENTNNTNATKGALRMYSYGKIRSVIDTLLGLCGL